MKTDTRTILTALINLINVARQGKYQVTGSEATELSKVLQDSVELVNLLRAELKAAEEDAPVPYA